MKKQLYFFNYEGEILMKKRKKILVSIIALLFLVALTKYINTRIEIENVLNTVNEYALKTEKDYDDGYDKTSIKEEDYLDKYDTATRQLGYLKEEHSSSIESFLYKNLFLQEEEKRNDYLKKQEEYNSEKYTQVVSEQKEHVQEVPKKEVSLQPSEQEIWQYCKDRWEYYDKLAGEYSADKYDKEVFNDAGNQFGITSDEAFRIWDKVDKEQLGVD